MSDGAIPPTAGLDFTKTIHNKAEGDTDPANNRVDDKPFVVCVTGAGKDLGFHIALAYVQAGVSGIVISSRTHSDLDALSAELKKVNSRIDILSRTCDTLQDDDVKRLAEATRQRFGRLDVCVANAGVMSKYLPDGSLPKGIMSDLDFERVIEYQPARHESKDGAKAFVVITSLAAHVADSKFVPVAYNTSKIAVCRVIEHMANDHGSEGLLAYSVHPGAVLTPQTQNHSLEKGDLWDSLLTDDVGLCGGFLTWLTRERRDWLNGRYLSVNWDPSELEGKGEIVDKDLLKFNMGVM